MTEKCAEGQLYNRIYLIVTEEKEELKLNRRGIPCNQSVRLKDKLLFQHKVSQLQGLARTEFSA